MTNNYNNNWDGIVRKGFAQYLLEAHGRRQTPTMKPTSGSQYATRGDSFNFNPEMMVNDFIKYMDIDKRLKVSELHILCRTANAGNSMIWECYGVLGVSPNKAIKGYAFFNGNDVRWESRRINFMPVEAARKAYTNMAGDKNKIAFQKVALQKTVKIN